ncbi:hypothetical protein AB0B89_19435 [Sphaerisporangium sp. NPDC049002]|uniref:hypothetical protein n=1 Tax=unclassified Sphaerisporangium TaxID=2630420 RepID=UPI00340D9805
MKRITTVVVLATMTMFGTTAMFSTVAAGGPPVQEEKKSVSKDQYRILTRQCRYADTAKTREECRAQVKEKYQIGPRPATDLDCRTYSSITVCGVLVLSDRQQQCVRESVESGLTYRRSEVECYAFS